MPYFNPKTLGLLRSAGLTQECYG